MSDPRRSFRRPGRRARGAGVALVLATMAGLAAACLPAAAGAGAIWKLEQPPPPAGAPFKVALGAPGDLQFFSRNRGLLGIEGNATIPRGLFYYNGQTWRQLSTVCGGAGDTMRIAWAGPREFWTVSQPSSPRVGNGTALCRFKDGAVAASFSTAAQSPDPFRQMNAATCDGPNDCWFGGPGSQDANGERVGAFHLHWDGSTLQTVYNPQGRAVSDLQAHRGELFESVLVGRRTESSEPPDLAVPETPKPSLVHRITGTSFANDSFLAADRAGVPDDGTELLSLDGAGAELWAGGGGAASGPSAPVAEAGVQAVARPPIALRLVGGAFQELPLDETQFGTTERISDLAVVPGTATAWAAVQRYQDRRSTTAKAKVTLVGADGSVSAARLPVSGAGRGAAARIECTDPNDCWLATYGGWLFHYTDGSAPALDSDPAFGSLIAFRPNEAAEQYVPDTPPADDSQLFAPPPLAVEPPPPEPTVRRLRPLLRKIRSRLRGTTLYVSFRLARRTKVGLVAYRKRRVVARTRYRRLRPGRHTLKLRLDRRRWPTRLSFRTGERSGGGGGGDPDTITTGAGAGAGTASGRVR